MINKRMGVARPGMIGILSIYSAKKKPGREPPPTITSILGASVGSVGWGGSGVPGVMETEVSREWGVASKTPLSVGLTGIDIPKRGCDKLQNP